MMAMSSDGCYKSGFVSTINMVLSEKDNLNKEIQPSQNRRIHIMPDKNRELQLRESHTKHKFRHKSDRRYVLTDPDYT